MVPSLYIFSMWACQVMMSGPEWITKKKETIVLFYYFKQNRFFIYIVLY